MTRFVELPIVSDRGSTIWVNPDHVVAVEVSHQPGKCYLLTEQGHRPLIALSQEAAVACLRGGPTREERQASFEAFRRAINSGSVTGDDLDLRDSVRENLTR